MSNPFVAEIRIFPFNFAPRGWAMCNGQLLPISQNTALFSLLGTNFGGDGKSTFGLPNLQGSVAMHTDQFSGGGHYPIGETGGEQTVTLLLSELPNHTHTMNAQALALDTKTPDPTNAVPGVASGQTNYSTTSSPSAQMNPTMVSVAGSSLPHNNMQPYLTLNYCIALQGVYPARN